MPGSETHIKMLLILVAAVRDLDVTERMYNWTKL